MDVARSRLWCLLVVCFASDWTCSNGGETDAYPGSCSGTCNPGYACLAVETTRPGVTKDLRQCVPFNVPLHACQGNNAGLCPTYERWPSPYQSINRVCVSVMSEANGNGNGGLISGFINAFVPRRDLNYKCVDFDGTRLLFAGDKLAPLPGDVSGDLTVNSIRANCMSSTSSLVCSGRGTCAPFVPGILNYKCKCNQGYLGNLCQNAFDNSCNTEGQCEAGTCDLTSSQCVCPKGMGGPQCSQCFDDDSSSACNGKGKCSQGKCVCEYGWTGKQCTINTQTNAAVTSTAPTSLPTAIAVTASTPDNSNNNNTESTTAIPTATPNNNNNSGIDDTNTTGSSSGLTTFPTAEGTDTDAITPAVLTTTTKTTKAPSKKHRDRPDSGSAAAQQESSSSRWSLLVLIAAIVSLVLFVIASVAYKLRLNKRPKSKFVDDPRHANNVVFSATTIELQNDSANSMLTLERAFMSDPAVLAARIDLDLIKLGELIGQGAQGEVYKGKCNQREVAVKRLLPSNRKSWESIQDLLAEVRLVASLEHPSIVEFVAVGWDTLANMSVVYEYMNGGNLRDLLMKWKREEKSKGFDPTKLRISMDIANGLTYLHSLSPKVLHRDLKSSNVLLHDNMKAKLIDFGVSRESADGTMTVGVGTVLWMAPEVMKSGRYNDKADVFSLGMLMSELDTHELPYGSQTLDEAGRRKPNLKLMHQIVTGKMNAEFCSEPSSSIVQLAQQCTRLEPQERPTAAQVACTLKQIYHHEVLG